MKIISTVSIILAVLVLAYIIRLYYLAGHSPPREGFGSTAALQPCVTDRPNGVSSINVEKAFFAPAFDAKGAVEVSMRRLKAAIANEPKALIIFEDATRLDVTFRTKIMDFPDDARFAIDASAQKIDFSSQARIGYSDLGVNRQRIERIRLAFAAQN
jgi:uncharacterized protein (DUF1499 family)